MAWYKDRAKVSQAYDSFFDDVFEPGASVPHSGIYECLGCGREVAANAGDPFPPQNHHQHGPSKGNIRWQLVVHPDYRSS